MFGFIEFNGQIPRKAIVYFRAVLGMNFLGKKKYHSDTETLSLSKVKKFPHATD